MRASATRGVRGTSRTARGPRCRPEPSACARRRAGRRSGSRPRRGVRPSSALLVAREPERHVVKARLCEARPTRCTCKQERSEITARPLVRRPAWGGQQLVAQTSSRSCSAAITSAGAAAAVRGGGHPLGDSTRPASGSALHPTAAAETSRATRIPITMPTSAPRRSARLPAGRRRRPGEGRTRRAPTGAASSPASLPSEPTALHTR